MVAPEKETSVQQPVGRNFDLLSIPWGHHVVLLDKAKRTEEARFYIAQTIENNWSRAILTLQKPEFAGKMNLYLSAVDTTC